MKLLVGPEGVRSEDGSDLGEILKTLLGGKSPEPETGSSEESGPDDAEETPKTSKDSEGDVTETPVNSGEATEDQG